MHKLLLINSLFFPESACLKFLALVFLQTIIPMYTGLIPS